jgi:penicillin-binding protein 1C
MLSPYLSPLLRRSDSGYTLRKTVALSCACFALGIACLWMTKPPLLANVTFSQAVYARDGTLLRLSTSADEKYRLFVPLTRISPLLQEAVLLHEDQYFYQHSGVNPAALARAFFQTYIAGGRRVGASTLSMQLARLKFKLNTRHIPGKLWQILRAKQIELHYSKQEILEAYLNLAPYGRNIEGVGAASLIYFRRNAHILTLPEAITLAVLPQSPSRRAPKAAVIQHAPLLEARNRLFSRWLENHPESAMLSQYFTLPLKTYHPENLPFYAPHQVQWLMGQNTDISEIHSTLDLASQQLLERILKNYTQSLAPIGVRNGAAMLLNFKTMEVLASVGSNDFFNTTIEGQVDGTRARRSPGSTLKPFLYALAFDQGIIHPMSLMKDSPSNFGDYNPENFDRNFNGPLPAKQALILSRNIPALELMTEVKKPSLHQFLMQAGIKGLRREEDYGLSLILGGAELSMRELVSLYAMLANGGNLKSFVETSDESARSQGAPLLSAEASFIALDALAATTRPQMRIGGPTVYWKTGTSNGFRDAWTAGVFGEYILVVWVGNFSGKSNPAFIGIQTAAPLFFQMVEALSQRLPMRETIAAIPHTLKKLRSVKVCAASGDLADDTCPVTTQSWFIAGVSPIKKNQVFRRIMVDRTTGLRACRYDPERTEYRIAEFWPSDIEATYRRAGIYKTKPPAFLPECQQASGRIASIDRNAPRITSPSEKVIYRLKPSDAAGNPLSLSAITQGSDTLFWFAGTEYIGKSRTDAPLTWQPKPGKYTIRAVDENGRSDSVSIRVALAPE